MNFCLRYHMTDFVSNLHSAVGPMKMLIRVALVILVAVVCTQATYGQQYGTASEARAMLERVVVGIKTDLAATIDGINKGDPKFSDRDLYPTCAGPDGKMVANLNPARLGIVQKESKDTSGKPYGEELARAQEGVFSEVSYLSPRPGSDKTPVPKIAFVTKVQGYICLVGYTP